MADDGKFVLTEDNTDAGLKALEEAVFNTLSIIGDKGADSAAALAPVQTGNLKNSITKEVSREEKAVYIGTAVEYAPAVEFGHKQEVGRYVPAIGKRLVSASVPPKPFLKPAIEGHLEEFKSIMEQELSEIKI